MAKSSQKPGPLSRDHRIASLDRRTRAGRVLRTVERDLIEHVGGHPTAAERLIINSAALKATRLSLLCERLLEDRELSDSSDGQALAWLNSMRLDLQALGLQRRVKDVTPTLSSYLASKVGASV